MSELASRIIEWVAIFGCGIAIGYGYANKVCSNEKLELSQAVIEKTKAQNKDTDKIITKYVNITREVAVYVPSENNTCTVVDWNFIVFHDGAAGYGMPSPSGYPNGKTASINTVASTIAANYDRCSKDADQLEALQEWAGVVSK